MRLVFVLVFAIGGLALADDLSQPLPNEALYAALANFISGIKGVGVLAGAAAVVQLLIVFFRTQFSSFAGEYKLLIVLGLSVVGVFIGNLLSGVNVLSALLSGPFIAAVQVFVNEFLKHRAERKVQVVGK